MLILNDLKPVRNLASSGALDWSAARLETCVTGVGILTQSRMRLCGPETMKIAADSLKPSVDSEPVSEGTMYRAPTSRAVIATFPAERAQRSQAAQSSWRLRDPEWTGRAAPLT